MWRNPFKKKEPGIKDKLVFMFTGTDGKDYFRWPKDLALSNDRFILALGLYQQMIKGLSTEQEDEFDETMATLLSQGMRADVWTKLAAVLELRRQERNHIVHKDIMLNLSAVYLIRKDEAPEEINQDIHRQKLEYFEKHINRDPNAFFLQVSIEEWKHLRELSITEQDRQWAASSKRIKAVSAFLEGVLPKISSIDLEPITTNNY